jgi:NNP family nitrate/nitrite transporter-like MFS transporter
MSATKGAFLVFTGFYVVCGVVTWMVYLRQPAEVRAHSLAGAGI